MITKRNIGTVVAIGGMAAAIALLTGLPTSARADELSDLRANQQLLQQRVDQLAAVTPGAMVPGAPTMAGSFPRSLLIPGTDTSIAITGNITLDVEDFLSGGVHNGENLNDVGEFGTLLGIPVGGTSGASHYLSFTPYESRTRIETRTPTPWGEAGTVLEWDWAGATSAGAGNIPSLHPGNSLLPRLRLAYGTIGGWLAGQDYTKFVDFGAHVDTIDFGGDVGSDATVRVPQVDYTYEGGNGFTAIGSIEAPDSAVFGADTASDATKAQSHVTDTVPDFIGALEWRQPWGHLRASILFRDLQYLEDTTGAADNSTRDFFGYGGSLSGSILPGFGYGGRDFFGWSVLGGDGIGRYLGNQYGLQSNNAVGPGLRVSTVTEYGGFAGYKHWWAKEWASDLSMGIVHMDYSTSILGGTIATNCAGGGAGACANRQLITAHANLFYYPTSFVHVGIEYMYGHREVIAGASGDLNVILGEFQVKF